MSTVEPPPLTQEEAEELLRAFRFDVPETDLGIERVIRSDAGPDAAAGLLARGVDGPVLWAALYVCAWAGADPAPLRPFAAHPDPSVSLMAAGGLVARGDATGFAPLIEKLTLTGPVTGYSPPGPLWADAVRTLVRHTAMGELGPPLDADDLMRAAAAERWRAWLASNAGTLRFDPATAMWSA